MDGGNKLKKKEFKMKTSKIILSAAALMALFTDCSQDEAAVQSAAPQSGYISLTSQMVPTRAASELQTTALSTSVKVGVFGVTGTSTIAGGNNNQYTVESDATLSATANMKWPDATSTVNIYAYAPYQEGWTYNAANSFSVKTDQSADADYLASDLLYAKASSTQTTEAIALGFTHKLSRINVTVKKSSEATTTLNGASVYITNTCTATTLNPSTGDLAATPSTVNNIKIGTLSAEPTAEGTTLYGITVPQTIAAGTKLVKIVTAEETPKTLVAKIENAATLESGKSYNFTASVGSGMEVELTLGTVTLTGWGDSEDLGSATMEEEEPEPLYATFGTPGGNATYTAPTYTWTATSNNLMTCFEFANGELAYYKELKFTLANFSDGHGMVRMGYYVGSTFTEFGDGFNSNGEKSVDLTTLGIDLSTVTKIAFGGRTGTGSVDIEADKVYLVPSGTTPGSTDSGTTTDDTKLYATFGSPGSNATYDATTFTYSCTQSYSNLMNCFTFSNGELANYSKLVFAISELSGNMRINFCYGSGSSDNLNISSNNNGSGAIFGSAGTKTITMEYVTTALATVNKTLADVTSIRFGGASTTASCVVKASEMYLE